MPKIKTLLFGVATAVAAWIFFQKFDLEGLDGVQIAPEAPATAQKPRAHDPLAPPPVRSTGSVRVATFNIQVFGKSKVSKPQVMDVLARIVRNFDLVAIQEIRSSDDDLLPNFVDLINSAGCHYDYVIGPRLGRTVSKEQYAYVFDLATIEVDRSQLYTVADPDDLLHREPLVGWFRVRGPSADQAFTFSLVNIHTDPDETKQELNVLDDVYRVVRDDGRREDDVIILGDLNVDDKNLGELGQLSGMTWVVSGTPTNTRGTAQYDNIVFQRQATSEFTGRAGIFDYMRQYNLSLEEALEVSDHMPVWAEFSAYEGGQPGRIASRPDASPR
ncbi:MAG TPA: endonuclease/exonuclease/phosphatase family protein [Candidatus Anammoximicrobium sp.]|nr:endonuclease/exonuclease/phosphatase family protein [Candidatus Anammoximicrobium sp.]